MPNVIYEWASKNCRNHSVLFMGSFFPPPLSFFIPPPTVAALKAGKNRARISRAETKREIFLRDFSRHFPRPPLPPTSFQLLGWGFPVDILSMTRVAGCQKREASSRNRGISYFVYTCSTSWFLFREILSTHSRIERRTCVISCMYCRNEYIYLLMYWFLLYIIIICICILYFIVYVYYYLYCW